ncbi:hypothetical protein HY413_01200 [Candidatus Kaiserbacteria bacterium]|nr:hypothetical protein [Candidatus Kaiserbacteria bacterium]
MEKTPAYTQHPDKAIEHGHRFSHVMAIALDATSNYKRGVIRCITSREGSVDVGGYIDRSVIHHVSETTPGHFTIGGRLEIRGEDVLTKFGGGAWECIGFEDPDLFFDERMQQLHLYFTLPLRHKVKGTVQVHLGHAVGKDLDSLEMTEPVLQSDPKGKNSAKEVSIAPENSEGIRYNLIESNDKRGHRWYSTVRVAIAKDMGKEWEFGPVAFHPGDHKIPWAGEHASPGPLFPKSFIDLGPGKMLGIMNGREASRKVGKKTHYGSFAIGLFIYDYEHGKIEWVSPQPLIQDTEAKTITFASQFVQHESGSGTLYAHVDDSFVRAYTLNADSIRTLMPSQ